MEKPMKKISHTGVRSVLVNFFALLAATAVCMAAVSVWNYVQVRPAADYADQGIHSFTPCEVLPIQVKNTSGSRRSRRLQPTKTVYMLYYRAADGSGYRWSREVVSRTSGQKIIREGTPTERRVLSITGENTYITVESHLTAETYTRGLKKEYMIHLIICILYLMIYVSLWIWKSINAKRDA